MTHSTIEDEIRTYCEAQGWRFKPWETTPWGATHDECPWPAQSMGAQTWPKARALRAQIVAELGLIDD